MSANEATHSAGSLRDHRIAAGLSQQALATRADCSVAMVRLLERGYAPEGSAVLVRVLDAVNVTLAQNDASPEGNPGSVNDPATGGPNHAQV